jgi:hypothetical protein
VELRNCLYTLILGTYLLLDFIQRVAAGRSQSMMEIWCSKNEQVRISIGVGCAFYYWAEMGVARWNFILVYCKNDIIS